MFISIGTIAFLLLGYVFLEACDDTARRPSKKDAEQPNGFGRLLFGGALLGYCYFSISNLLMMLGPTSGTAGMGDVETGFRIVGVVGFMSFGWVLILIAAPMGIYYVLSGLSNLGTSASIIDNPEKEVDREAALQRFKDSHSGQAEIDAKADQKRAMIMSGKHAELSKILRAMK